MLIGDLFNTNVGNDTDGVIKLDLPTFYRLGVDVNKDGEFNAHDNDGCDEG